MDLQKEITPELFDAIKAHYESDSYSWIHEFSMIKGSPDMNLGIQPVNISLLKTNEFTFSCAG